MNEFFAEPDPRLALIVSDGLVDRGEFSSVAKELIDPQYHKPVATLAITPTGKRVSDIDRVVSSSATPEQLCQAVSMAVMRLHYVMPPAKREYEGEFVVRQVNDEFELAQYYKLRFHAYSVMGYISPRKEQVPSKLEIDGCDMRAIHLGAFCKSSGYEQLVGTARILLTGSTNSKWAEPTRLLLKNDPLLNAIVNEEALPLCLPVFQSQSLNADIHEVYVNSLTVGELSRVIVEAEWRGAGLSSLLIRSAVEEAGRVNAHRLYLECLPVHESLYGKFGFKTILGSGAELIGAGRTVIAMKMEFAAACLPVPANNP